MSTHKIWLFRFSAWVIAGVRFSSILEWSPETNSLPAAPGEPTPDTQGPSFQEALREQLGLRLESARAPLQILVIDRVERPSEN